MKRIILPLLLALAAGCAKAPPVPSDRFYRLPDPPAMAPAPPLSEGVILVRPFTSDGLHNERPILYGEGTDALTLQQYSYHYWVEAPPRLLQNQLVSFLRAQAAAPMVLTDVGVDAELILSGRIIRLERHLADGGSRAAVALELRADRARDPQPVLLREYRAEVPLGEETVAATVAAVDRGLNDIFGEFSSDLRRVLGR